MRHWRYIIYDGRPPGASDVHRRSVMVVGIRVIALFAALATAGIFGLNATAHASAPQSPALKECPAGKGA